MTKIPLRRTKIVCTIGPSCQDPETLLTMAKNGMSIARINASHGNRESYLATIKMLEDLNTKTDYPVAIMLDTRGAEIRTSDVEEPIVVTKNQEVVFTYVEDKKEYEETVIRVNYQKFANDVRDSKIILLDNGELSFDVLAVEDNGLVRARAREDGKIGKRRHVNIPGADIDLPSLNEKDWEDIALAAEMNLDFVALSFIRDAEEVVSVREFLKDKNPKVQIISKIETKKSVKNIAEILEVSDGIMVARGDLGADVPFEELPAIQDEIVYRCRDAGKPVIVATHMLESMIYHPMPTRAEVTDTAYAVMTGADATMLSGETAGGKFPVGSLQAMVRIHTATEAHMSRFGKTFDIKVMNSAEELAEQYLAVAEAGKSAAFLAKTENGECPRILSKFRSEYPIIAYTSDPMLFRQLMFHFGVFPIFSKDGNVKKVLDKAKKLGIVEKGDSVLHVDDSLKSTEVISVS